MKYVALILGFSLAMISVGCGVGAQSNAQPPAQPQVAGSQSASCTLALTYTCPDAVVGQPYVCTPTVSEVPAYSCDAPPSAAQASVQAMATPEKQVLLH